MSTPDYDLWVNEGKKRDDAFIDLIIGEIKRGDKRIENIYLLFGNPDTVTKDKNETHDYYFYTIMLSGVTYEMYIWIGTRDGSIFTFHTNEKRYWPPKPRPSDMEV